MKPWLLMFLPVFVSAAPVDIQLSAQAESMQPDNTGEIVLSLNHAVPEGLNDLEIQWSMPDGVEVVSVSTQPEAFCEGNKARRCSFGHHAWTAGDERSLTVTVMPHTSGAWSIQFNAFATADLQDAEGSVSLSLVSESPSPADDPVPDVNAPTSASVEDAPVSAAETAPVSPVEAAPEPGNDEVWNEHIQEVLQMSQEEAVWLLDPSMSLRQNLQAWCNQAGWTLVWSAVDLDAEIIAAASWQSSFEDAIAQAMKPFTRPRLVDGHRLALNYHIAKGNKVLMIQEVSR